MPFNRPKPSTLFRPASGREQYQKDSHEGNIQAEEVSDRASEGTGSGRISAAATPALRAARVLGDGGRKPEGGREKEGKGRKEHTVDITICPRPITCIYFFSPLARHLQALLQLGQQAAKLVLGRRGRVSHGIGTTVGRDDRPPRIDQQGEISPVPGL